MKFVLVTFSVSIVLAARDSALPGCSHRIPGQFHAVPRPFAFAAFNEVQGSGRSGFPVHRFPERGVGRSEEHTSELQSLMRISYAVFCLKKKNKQPQLRYTTHIQNQ